MTAVPDNLPDVIATRAREVTRDAEGDFDQGGGAAGLVPHATAASRYSLEQRSGSGMDLLADFVTDDRVGYCEQFAAAMAAMGRVLGIPSRVVVGFLDGTTQDDGRILYTSDDRHAWPEMYFTGVGWVRFEPTPGSRAGATPSWTRQSAETAAPTDGPSDAASEQPAPRPEDAAVDTQSDEDRLLPHPGVAGGGAAGAPGPGSGPGARARASSAGAASSSRRSRSTSPRVPGQSCARLHSTSGWTGPSSAHRASRRAAWSTRCAAGGRGPPVAGRAAGPGGAGPLRTGRRPDSGVGTLDPELRSRTVETVESWRRVMAGSVAAGARLAWPDLADVAGAAQGRDQVGGSVALSWRRRSQRCSMRCMKVPCLGALSWAGVAASPPGRRILRGRVGAATLDHVEAAAGGRRSRRAGPRRCAAAAASGRADHATRRGRWWPSRASPRTRGLRARSGR